MALTPKFLGPDGVYRERYVFTTDVSYRFFQGKMDPNTADMQVSIRGGGFTSNPDYILFEGETFTIPNPSAFAEGLQLLQGSNRIEVKSVLTNGETTTAGVVEANLALDRNVRALTLPPSGIYLERLDQTIRITVTGNGDPNVTGYNVYASISPGGGLSGYKKINIQPIISFDTEESLSQIGTLTVDSVVLVNNDGSRVADPLLFRVVGMQTDNAGNTLQQDFDESVVVSDLTTRFRTTTLVQAVDTLQKYSFVHDRRALPSDPVNPAVPYGEFTAIPDEDPLYYTVTAIYLINGVEYESSFSQEVLGSPLIVTPSIADFPAVSRQQIVRDSTLAIFRAHPEVDVKPGSYLRDTFIDPFSTEAERIRFVIGFLQAAQSFTTLLSIDDPSGTKLSVSVNQSPYKLALMQAFFLQDTRSVQNLIDNAFDHLASRRGVQRRPGARARGEVTFYVTRKPTTTIFVPIGTQVSNGSVTFRTTSTARITTAGAGSNYNPATGRWSASAYVQAIDTGSGGNLTRDQIRNIVNGPSNIQVTNYSNTFGGRSSESNYELAIRSDAELAGVDSGTYRGYVKTASEVPGVMQVNVVEAGHQLMMRDLDVSGRHWGGKVDVWLRGESSATLTDLFAFSFEVVVNGQFEPIGDIGNLRFRATDPRISDANPLIEMLDLPDWGYEFQAINPHDGSVKTLSLEGATILRPDGIQLSADHNDPTLIRLTDIFQGTFRFRTGNKHVFARQPVDEVTSFLRVLDSGESSLVSPSAYKLFHPSDPMDLGRSTEAGDYIQVVQPLDGTLPENIPSGVPLVVTGEEHVVLKGPEYLNNLGINKYTVHIYNFDRSIEYLGPFHPGTPKDFSFQDESGESPLAFVTVSGSRITEGMKVLVDYQHDENYLVEYTTNAMVQAVQNDLDDMRHCTADVVAKNTIPVGVNIFATVVLIKNQSASTVEGLIRTALGRLFGSLSLGQPIRQGDVINTIELVSGVSYAVVPLTHMARQDGATVVREPVVTTQQGTDWVSLPNAGWDTDSVKVYLLQNALYSGTSDGGGDYNEFRGVFFNDLPLTLYPSVPQFDGYLLKGTSYGACIIGGAGMSIPNYPTLSTANRVLVALPVGVTPSSGAVTVTYIVNGDTGTKSIEPGPVEYLVLGDMDFTFDEDKDFSALVSGRRQ